MSALQLPLQTERLTLRGHEPADRDSLLRFHGQANVARYLLDEPWDAEIAEQKLTKRLSNTDLNGESGALDLVVECAGEVIGDVQIWYTDRERAVAEIGWVLDPEYGGRGYAREAVAAVLDLAFAHYRLHRVAAQMDARNTGSAKLAAAVGMRHEASLRQDWWSKGEWTDTFVFGMLASDRTE